MWKQWRGKPQNLSLTVADVDEIWDRRLRKEAGVTPANNRLQSKTNWLPVARFRSQSIRRSGEMGLQNCDILLSLRLLLVWKLSNCICYFVTSELYLYLNVHSPWKQTGSVGFATCCASLCACVCLRQSCSVCCTALLLRDGTVKMKVIRGVWSSPWGSKLLIAKMKTTSRNKERCK